MSPAGVGPAGVRPEEEGASRLRVASYNLRQLRGDREALVEVLRTLAADVVAVQEPPRGPRGRRRLAQLAAAAGLGVAVSGRGARTTALLVRSGLPVTGACAGRLPWRPRSRSTLTRRGLAVATVEGVRVVSVHLGLDARDRARHLRHVLAHVGCGEHRERDRPVVVAGDLNEPPDGPSWRGLTAWLTDVTAEAGPTFTARSPRRRLDVVLADPALRAGGADRVDDAAARRASDHLPVVVDLVVPC